jgi:hypothetical protein
MTRTPAPDGRRAISRITILLVLVVAAGCRGEDPPASGGEQAVPAPAPAPAAGEASRLAAAVEELFLSNASGTELRAQLFVQVLAPGESEETPLVQLDLPSHSAPGPHTWEGVLHADLEVLRQLFASGSEIEVEDDMVHFPARGVTLLGHRHGDALYVPVRLFARQYGAYARIWGALANHGVIWPAEILHYWRDHGPGGAAALLEAEAEGLISGVHSSPKPGQN